MEKILFISNSFGMGGAEKVLLDMVRILKNRFAIHVLVFHDRGPLKTEMEKHCRIFTLCRSFLHALFFRKIGVYRRWRTRAFIRGNHYKAVVGFMEGKSTDLLAEVETGCRKIAWVHNDFRKLDILADDEKTFTVYDRMETIVCVSKDAKQAFVERFPFIHGRLEVIYNLIDEQNIRRLAELPLLEEKKGFTFVNVGMLRKQKCQDRLVRIAKKLKDEGYLFQIRIIGDGPLFSYLHELIKENGVEESVSLLGMRENPYPEMKNCDCFVLCSDYEGYGIVVKEALFLRKLILTTDVVGPREILEGGKYGLIVENNEQALYTMMRRILDLDRQGKQMEVLKSVSEYQGDNELIGRQLIELFAA